MTDGSFAGASDRSPPAHPSCRSPTSLDRSGSTQPLRSARLDLDQWIVASGAWRPSVGSMSEERTFPVTLMRAGPGLPYFEAYRYRAEWLPTVGDLITVTRADASEADPVEPMLVYVTRVEPNADTPIRATEAKGVRVETTDELIVAA